MSGRWPGLIERFRDHLPVSTTTPVITLNEGNTPLIYAENISRELGIELYLKFEGLNPTGSFKDRGMTMAVSKAKEEGAIAIMCASTGNTSASAAAYAAKAGMKAFVLIPAGKIAKGKLAQAVAYGAVVVAIDGNFDEALQIVRDLTASHPITLVNSLNPFRLQGQKTGAFEIVDQLGKAPDMLAIPVGNAGNITAYWMGFKEYKDQGLSSGLPKLFGVQAKGADPIVQGHPISSPTTIASALRIGNPARWKEAEAAVAEAGGSFTSVDDDEIRAAHRMLSSQEGIFCELASAAPLAGIRNALQSGEIQPGTTITAILTGNGLKDYEMSVNVDDAIVNVPATQAAVEDLIYGTNK